TPNSSCAPATSAARTRSAAAAVVTDAESASADDLAAVGDLGGPGTPVLVAGADGVVRATLTTG
ncbi:cytidine deaminase, partial [Streptomyces sp. NPDC005568]